MKNERLSIDKKIMRTILAATVVGGISVAPAMAKRHDVEVIPAQAFHELDLKINSDNNLNFPIVDFAPAEILSPTEQKIKDIKDKAKSIYNFAKESGKINANLLDDLNDNLPFYIAAGEKYNIDWIVLWIIHEAESGASDPNSKAFDSSNANSRVKGSWQIDISWGKDFAKDSFSGLEYVSVFPQRHEGDASGAAQAAHMLRRNLDKYNDLGYEKALFNALSLYCGKDQATIRIDKIEKFNKIFSEQINTNL